MSKPVEERRGREREREGVLQEVFMFQEKKKDENRIIRCLHDSSDDNNVCFGTKYINVFLCVRSEGPKIIFDT